MIDVLYKYISHLFFIQEAIVNYSAQEFDTAFAKVVNKYPFVRRSTAANVLTNMSDLWSRYKSKGKKFGEIMRLALNESNVRQEAERSAYGSLIGHLYNPRAQAAKRFRKTAPTQRRRPPQAPPSPTIVSGKNGQLAWEI